MNAYKQFPWLAFVCIGVIVGAILGVELAIPVPILLIGMIIAALIIAAMALWKRANEDASGYEWWQDDSCSGWRGR